MDALSRPDAEPGPAVTVAHTTASLHARNGGPPRTVSALAEGLGQAGASVVVVAVEDGGRESTVVPDARAAQTRFVPPGRRVASRFRQAVESVQPDLVHDHGLWLPTNHAAAQAAARRGVPRVVSTRGMLEPWARAHRRLKKTVAWWTYQRRDLHAAAVLHATAPAEAQNLRGLGLRQSIAVIPNGVDVPSETATLASRDGAPRRALFLSRVHPKKGLPLFLDAWAEVRPSHWELLIVGPDEDGHRAELEGQAARLGIAGDVHFRDAVADDAKWDLYRSADLFVLPTHSENFGVVVAEALAAGVPALTTVGAPWQDLRDHGCGWWTEIGVRPLAEALRDAVSRSDAERAAMGARGRALVAEQYGWPRIAQQMLAVYEWTLGRRPTVPSCISRL